MHKHRSNHLILFISSFVFAMLITQNSYAYIGQLTYFGGQLGGSDLHYSASNQGFPEASSSSNGSGLAWHVFAGYQMNANFAVEAGYVDYNEISIKNIGGDKNAKETISQRSADLMGKLIYPLNSLFDIYVKGGIAYMVADKELNSTAKKLGASVSDDHGLEIAYGVGASYEFYPNVKLDFTWQKVSGSGGLKDADFAGAGITLFFG